MTRQEKLDEMITHSPIIGDTEDVIDLMHDFLIAEADRLKEEEPYAINSIRDFETAAHVVWLIRD